MKEGHLVLGGIQLPTEPGFVILCVGVDDAPVVMGVAKSTLRNISTLSHASVTFNYCE